MSTNVAEHSAKKKKCLYFWNVDSVVEQNRNPVANTHTHTREHCERGKTCSHTQ